MCSFPEKAESKECLLRCALSRVRSTRIQSLRWGRVDIVHPFLLHEVSLPPFPDLINLLPVFPRCWPCQAVPGSVTPISHASTWLPCLMRLWSLHLVLLLSSALRALWPSPQTHWGKHQKENINDSRLPCRWSSGEFHLTFKRKEGKWLHFQKIF